MLGWLRRMVVAVFGRGDGTRESVNPALMASKKARRESARVRRRVRPHVDRSRELIAAYEAKDGTLRGRA